jgi:Mrp family chromosome partitioning ATPase
MSRTNASPFQVTLIGPVPKVIARPSYRRLSENGSSSAPVLEATPFQVPPLEASPIEGAQEPIRAELVHVPMDNGGRRRIVITEQTELPDVDSKCVVLRWPTSPQARTYRLLRHRLIARSAARVVAVTSAGPAEGKTTCAMNLALAIAEDAMTRVLLVEANPFRPSLAQAFALKSSSSLNAWTLDAMSPTWPIAVANIAGTRLDVAASCSGGQGLDRLLFGLAMRDVRNAYDYVVIDTPSVLESGDANVAAECADGVVVTALATKSHRSALRRSIDQLRPATIFGVVLLDV